MWRIYQFLRDRTLEFIAGGLTAVIALFIYFGLMLSGSPIFERGVALNLDLLKYLGSTLPDMYGWNVSGMVKNLAIGYNAEKSLFQAEVAWFVFFLFLAIRRILHHCRRLLRHGFQTHGFATGAALVARTPNATQARQGVRSMRALRTFYSIMGDVMWVLTVTALAVLVGLFPSLSAQPLPFFGTVTQALIYLMLPATVLLVLFNMLSGRWPAEGHHSRNVWVSRIAFVVLGVIIFVLFVMNGGVTGLPTNLSVTLPAPAAQVWAFNVDVLVKWALFGALIFAFIDWWYTKSDEFMASSLSNAAYAALQQENAELRRQLGTRSHATGAPAAAVIVATAPAEVSQPISVAIRPVIMQPVYLRPGQTAPDLDDEVAVATPASPQGGAGTSH